MKRKNGITMVLQKVIKTQRVLSAGLLFIIAGSIVAALFPPLILKTIVNQLTKEHTIGIGLACGYFGMLVLSGLLDAVKEILITIFGQKVTRGLRHEMCKKLSYLPASYYTANESGAITSRFVNDVDTVESLFANGIISMVADACKMVSILFMIFIMSKGLGCIMVVLTPLLFYMTRQFQKRMLKAQLKNRVAMAKVNNHIPETIQNIRMIHTFGKDSYMEKRYEEYIEESYEAVEKSNFYDAIYSPIILVISAMVIAVMMVLAAMGEATQSFFGMSVGTAVAIISYVGKVFEPLESIGMEIENIQSAVAGSKRINEFLNEKERTSNGDSIVLKEQLLKKETGETCISFDHVTFGYRSDTVILNDLDLAIKQGESVTLAGRTGVGKSTVFKLILGMYSPMGGTIKIFGLPADQIPDKEKRSLFGYVEQSFELVPGTIADQITLYDMTITKEEIEAAAKLTGIHEYIMGLTKQYDTVCTEELFSKGQMQLLSIARAVVKNPPIMLLDEITANLDSATEQKVLAAIERASKDRTVVSISHRIFDQMQYGTLIELA